ncbi:MAG: DNA/RNA helicase domain-containing protein [Rhodospirillaceae bacterium]
MIIYRATKNKFLEDALSRDIEQVVADAYRERTGGGVAPGEFRAWRESLLQMARVLRDEDIPARSGVAIEYKIPQTNKRVDFIVTGLDDERASRAVIVELKQWSQVKRTDKDGIVLARRGGRTGEVESPHPSYQAWSYATLLETFNAAVYEGGIALRPCAYLHNYERDGVIDHAFYAPHIERAPLFLTGALERRRLQEFIKRHVRYGDDGELLYRIEGGQIRPSKMLADSVLGMLQGNIEFVLIDEQKLVFETALKLTNAAHNGTKQVLIVKGGPGTGKSVVAVNLLATLIGREKNARYVSKNAAPRAVYELRLTGSFRRTHISNLFSGSGVFSDAERDSFDVLIVDEAHRLNEKSGLYGNLGENQIKELVSAARCTIFFVDDDQRVTLRDIGHVEALRRWAACLGAEVTECELTSQFRCNGSDGYLAWVDHTLEIRSSANETLDTDEFDFRVLDSPNAVHELIHDRNLGNNRSRVVAGYCWEWASKRDATAFDIVLPEHGYRRRWNLTQHSSLWIVADDSVREIGCIHTCQGLELDYVGVIIGPDLVFRNGRIVTVPERRARSDKSLSGLRRLAKENPTSAAAEADRIIKNTYRTLLTRGMRGCYVFCVDPDLAAHLRSRLKARTTMHSAPEESPGLPASMVAPLRRVPAGERAGLRAVPLVDLRFAAGNFSNSQSLDLDADEWVEVPDWVHIQPGLFVAQVVGESMNRRIPNGAWCLFRANPEGTRNGKVVVAQHRSIDDPELGGTFTIKVYSSSKTAVAEGGWRHTQIRLEPDTDQAGFEPIVIRGAEDGEFRIVAEFLAVLS